MDGFLVQSLNFAGSMFVIVSAGVCFSMIVFIRVYSFFTVDASDSDSLQDKIIVWWMVLTGVGFMFGCGASVVEGTSPVYIPFAILGFISFYGAHRFNRYREPMLEVMEREEELERSRVSQADDDDDWDPLSKSANSS
jgi:hypothetical protein